MKLPQSRNQRQIKRGINQYKQLIDVQPKRPRIKDSKENKQLQKASKNHQKKSGKKRIFQCKEVKCTDVGNNRQQEAEIIKED